MKETSDTKVWFVADELNKKSACCIVGRDEHMNDSNQILNSSECPIVFPNIAPCLNIVNNAEEQ